MNLALKKKKHFKTSSVNWLKGGGWWKERNRWYHRLFQAALRSDQIAHIFWNFLILRFLLPPNRFFVCFSLFKDGADADCSILLILGILSLVFQPSTYIYNPSTGRPRAGLHQERVFWTIRWDAGLFLVTVVRVRAPTGVTTTSTTIHTQEHISPILLGFVCSECYCRFVGVSDPNSHVCFVFRLAKHIFFLSLQSSKQLRCWHEEGLNISSVGEFVLKLSPWMPHGLLTAPAVHPSVLIAELSDASHDPPQQMMFRICSSFHFIHRRLFKLQTKSMHKL